MMSSSSVEMSRSIQAPQPDNPWSVDVVSLLPERLVHSDGIDDSIYCTTGAVCSRWHCLVLVRNSSNNNSHNNHNAGPQLHVWYAPPNASLTDQKHRVGTVTLNHSNLLQVPSSSMIRVQIHVDPQSPNVANVYAVNAATGHVLLWHLSAASLLSQQPAEPKKLSTLTVIPLGKDSDQFDEVITTFHAAPGQAAPRLWVGTNYGRTFWISQTPIPLSLGAQLVQERQTNRTSASAYFTSLVFGSSSSSSSTQGAAGLAAPVVQVAALSDHEFCVVHADGLVQHWTMETTDTAKRFFHARVLLQLDRLAQPNDGVASDLQVLAAAARGRHLYVLFGKVFGDESSRLYWLRHTVSSKDDDMDDTSSIQWLNGLVDPLRESRVEGLVVAANQIAYTVVSTRATLLSDGVRMGGGHSAGGSTTLFAWGRDGPHQLDATVPGSTVTVVPGTVTHDWVKHAALFWDASGIALRFDLSTSESRPAGATANPLRARNLQTHLRNVFWDLYSKPNQTPRLPPSLMGADQAELEQAVLSFSSQLLAEGTDEPSRPLDLLLALLDLLRQTTKYRDLSNVTRWHLLSMGQQAAAFATIASTRPASVWEQQQLQQLQPSTVADWLEHCLDRALVGGGQDQQVAVLQWCCQSVDAAMAFRNDRGHEPYNIQVTDIPKVQSVTDVPTWTSHEALARVWVRQVTFWKTAPVPSVELAQSLSQKWLQSCTDNYLACPGDDTKAALVAAQRQVFVLLRRICPWQKDDFLFELCLAYGHADGVCEIIYDHERRGDRTSFRMAEVLEQCGKVIDIASGLSLEISILGWYLKERHFGHVLQYGEWCPGALAYWMERDASLASYRWMYDLQQGQHARATQSLLENTKRYNAPLSDTLKALSLASLTNRVVEPPADEHRVVLSKHQVALHRTLEKKRELVMAQRALLGGENNDSPLEPADQLLYRALDQFDAASDAVARADLCVIGLAIAASYESVADMQAKACRVWCKAIQADQASWQTWLSSSSSQSTSLDTRVRDVILDATVFGLLLGHMEEDTADDWERVSYRNPAVEHAVLQEFDPSGQDLYPKLQRLLRSVAGVDSSIL